MKKFNLEKAVAGEKLVTRDGREVTEFVYFKTEKTDSPCCAIVGGAALWFGTNGTAFGKDNPKQYDLFMAPKTRTVYVQVFDNTADAPVPALKAVAFENKGDAEYNVKTTSWPVLVVALPVEIEG
jgi:hypothetical protein